MPHDADGIPQHSAADLQEILQNKSAKVIDVRTDEEYDAGHIPNVPNRPMQDLMNWIDELNPSDSYVFVCRSGGRSQRVASYLKENGFPNVANFNGGMLSWDGDLE